MTPNNFQEHKTIKKWLKKQKRAWYGLNNAILQYIHPKNVHKEPKIWAIVSHELCTKLLFISSIVSYLYKCNAQNAQFGSAKSCNFKRIGSLWNKTSKLLKRPNPAVTPYLSSKLDLGTRIHMRLLISCQLLFKTADEN